MNLANGLWATINKNNEVWTNLFGETKKVSDVEETIVRSILRVYRKRTCPAETKLNFMVDMLKRYGYVNDEEIKQNFPEINEANVKASIQKLINFFSEFEFEPNYRFLNTFTYCCSTDFQSAKDYITHYFELTDSSYTTTIIEKESQPEPKPKPYR